MEPYPALEWIFARAATFTDVSGLLEWDADTMMPAGAAGDRSEQLATLKRVARDLLVTSRTQDLLDRAEEASSDLGEWQKANLREMRRAFTEASAVPADLTEASARATSKAQQAWQEARKNNDFASFAPKLTEVLTLQRETGKAKGAALGMSPYDALLDGFDPGLTEAKLEATFAGLRKALPGLIQEACEHQRRRPAPSHLSGSYRVCDQKRLAHQLLDAVGFDFDHGRLDVSPHPFSGGANHDVRVAVRYDERDPLSSVSAVMHESGHALYEQGRPEEWLYQPVGAPRAMSIHESQALLIEMQACRNRAFASYLGPRASETFGVDDPAWKEDNLHRLMTRVEPGLIRVDADEVTYPAHILLRFDLERAMVAGDLAVEDLPGAFNEGMRHWLGLDVPDDARGCLQDVHWAGGSWGYFPTYTLGAMAAAQLFQAAVQADSDTIPAIRQGDFTRLRHWLRANVHGRASLLETEDLIVAATGRPLKPEVFIDHLRARYLGEAAD
ncbi:peptidase M32 [Methylobacterium tarhaniae]|uniref:Metal-dependent carboxypeptidase n=1 Tax=Methylobacterium tarhaniae TaxID=1187852 RepID=A0A0J6TE46_9HYPH|nr:carboxypeptidase M32 [Methylobacterium tarhaniae]KMO44167.1 peptidase M32 [Methylobacterium tarhaniae]